MRPTAPKLNGRSAITERRSWNPDEQYQHQYELRQKRALGETQQKQRKAQAARDEKQARLEAHLQRRSAAYRETVGSSPPMTTLQEWTMEYMSQQERKHQAEREARLAAIEAEHYDTY